MSGGLLDLVSKGCNDINILNPEITFFKSVYMRHTFFSVEPIYQKFVSDVDFNKRSVCKLSLIGDLISKICLVIELPEISSNIEFAWKKRIGFQIIDNIEIEIGSQLIDRHYGHWLNIWYELTKSKYEMYDKLIGNEILTTYSYTKPSYKLFIPLQFWFNQHIGLSLPIMCMQNNNININLSLEKIENCINIAASYIKVKDIYVNFKKGDKITQGCNSGIFSHYDNIEKKMYFENKAGTFTKGNIINKEGYICCSKGDECKNSIKFNYDIFKIKNAFLIVDYIYIDTNERTKFYNYKHEYLIEQVFYDEKYVGNNEVVELDFKYLCKQFIWTFDTKQAVKEKILFNDNDGISERHIHYFNSVQPYQYYNNTPSKNINVFSFSSQPLQYQPYGYINLNNIKLGLKINNKEKILLKSYSVSYNLLRISNNACGIVFNKY